MLHNGTTVVVEEVDSRVRLVRVFNFSVANAHNYFVGGDGVLVHNVRNRPTSTQTPALKGTPYHPDAVHNRIRPPYKANPKHANNRNPNAGIEPYDSVEAYKNAIRGDMGTWYACGKDRDIYRYFSDYNGEVVHWSGSTGDKRNPLNPKYIPNDVKKYLGFKK